MARPRKYTDEQIVAALEKTGGLIFHAAKKVGCNADTIHERVKTSQAVRDCLRDLRGGLVDTAESKLFAAVKKGEAWAVQFALKNLGKDRGYVERSESSTSLTGDVNLNHGINDPEAALAPYAAVIEKFLAGNGPPAPAPEVPRQPVGEAEAPSQAGVVPPAR